MQLLWALSPQRVLCDTPCDTPCDTLPHGDKRVDGMDINKDSSKHHALVIIRYSVILNNTAFWESDLTRSTLVAQLVQAIGTRPLAQRLSPLRLAQETGSSKVDGH